MSGWNHAMKGGLYTGGVRPPPPECGHQVLHGRVRPPPPERGYQVYGGQQELLLMGYVGEDAAPVEHPCRESGPSRPRLNR